MGNFTGLASASAMLQSVNADCSAWQEILAASNNASPDASGVDRGMIGQYAPELSKNVAHDLEMGVKTGLLNEDEFTDLAARYEDIQRLMGSGASTYEIQSRMQIYAQARTMYMGTEQGDRAYDYHPQAQLDNNEKAFYHEAFDAFKNYPNMPMANVVAEKEMLVQGFEANNQGFNQALNGENVRSKY